MRWLFIAIAGILFLCTTATAQDVIQRTDGVKIEGKVVEIKGAEIWFTKNEEANGSMYIISKEDVASVTYENGSVQQFATSFTPTPIIMQPVAFNKGQHILALKPLDLAFTNFSLIYEHLSANHKFGIRLPLSIGINHRQVRGDIYDNFAVLRNRTFGTGLDLNFYVGRPDKFKYYIGPSFQLGFFKYISDNFYNPYPLPTYQTKNGTYYAFLINNGFWYQLSKQAVIGLDMGLGLQKRVINSHAYPYYGNASRFKLSGNLSVGFQF